MQKTQWLRAGSVECKLFIEQTYPNIHWGLRKTQQRVNHTKSAVSYQLLVITELGGSKPSHHTMPLSASKRAPSVSPCCKPTAAKRRLMSPPVELQPLKLEKVPFVLLSLPVPNLKQEHTFVRIHGPLAVSKISPVIGCPHFSEWGDIYQKKSILRTSTQLSLWFPNQMEKSGPFRI